ncbi:hypothetical protein SAMN05443545_108130 [Aidingimonas halophila]|uniref:Uncharacterized protein n=1 Tax=Aidingimonas halophila TaxID=574349 RepID=A0A1H3FSN5_9GAMM|nr:hypothetical protein SAMN05443545_108130 [Aidingimonas halophila]
MAYCTAMGNLPPLQRGVALLQAMAETASHGSFTLFHRVWHATCLPRLERAAISGTASRRISGLSGPRREPRVNQAVW